LSAQILSKSNNIALWNASAFFTYIFTVKIFGLKWEVKRLVAVVVAIIGAMVVIYGSTTESRLENANSGLQVSGDKSTVAQNAFPSALVGDFLTLLGSVGYGLYQVVYKKYAALPHGPEPANDTRYQTVAANEDEIEAVSQSTPSPASLVPFGLHANLITSTIGVLTLAIFWLPLPFLHYWGIEPFQLPSDIWTVVSIAGIALSGVLFNAGFMVSFTGRHRSIHAY
jgi:drug/metabolite transporter (DMT)-like permease